MKIGLLSDTHSFLDERIYKHFKQVDEIWHAGDIGSISVLDDLEKFKPTRAVYGNIDGQEIRIRTKKEWFFSVEGCQILITHIGGYPPKYKPDLISKIKNYKPNLFICGHSHILKIMHDNTNKLLHINPGAFGNYGIHQVKTLVRFDIHKTRVQNLEVIELSR